MYAMQMKTWLLVSVVGLSASFGCGDDDDKGTPGGSTKDLSELTESEAKGVCDGFVSRFEKMNDPLKRIGCIEELGADCDEQAIDECVDEAPDPIEVLPCAQATADDLADGCENTSAAEAYACIDAVRSWLTKAANDLTCDPEPGKAFDPPAACTRIEDECPIYSSDFYELEGQDAETEIVDEEE
jgi:hypothetical protein